MIRGGNDTSGLILHLRLRQLALVALALVTIAFSNSAFSLEEVIDPDFKNDGMIDVHYPVNILEPYRDRRPDWGFQFSVNTENFFPKKYTSLKDGLTYEELFGKLNLTIFQASLGLKYNFVLGALTMDFIGGAGKVVSTRSGSDRELSVMKKAATLGWTLDAIAKEPYIAPYVQGQIFEMDYSEKGSANGSSTGRTAWTSGYTVGLLIQLNSLDPTDTAHIANSDFGLNNTYLDVFATEYNTSNAPDDPQFQTAFNWGIGLKLEF